MTDETEKITEPQTTGNVQAGFVMASVPEFFAGLRQAAQQMHDEAAPKTWRTWSVSTVELGKVTIQAHEMFLTDEGHVAFTRFDSGDGRSYLAHLVKASTCLAIEVFE